MKATEQYFSVVLFIILCKVVLNCESLVEILPCDPSNERYWGVLSCSDVYSNGFYGTKSDNNGVFPFLKTTVLKVLNF